MGTSLGPKYIPYNYMEPLGITKKTPVHSRKSPKYLHWAAVLKVLVKRAPVEIHFLRLESRPSRKPTLCSRMYLEKNYNMLREGYFEQELPDAMCRVFPVWALWTACASC